ncbi:hypothetical protein AVW09_03115 [Microbacterium sp. T32]|nr:hypothetical protein AVW09_03115 [Microbacterium sp. T32]
MFLVPKVDHACAIIGDWRRDRGCHESEAAGVVVVLASIELSGKWDAHRGVLLFLKVSEADAVCQLAIHVELTDALGGSDEDKDGAAIEAVDGVGTGRQLDACGQSVAPPAKAEHDRIAGQSGRDQLGVMTGECALLLERPVSRPVGATQTHQVTWECGGAVRLHAARPVWADLACAAAGHIGCPVSSSGAPALAAV